MSKIIAKIIFGVSLLIIIAVLNTSCAHKKVCASEVFRGDKGNLNPVGATVCE